MMQPAAKSLLLPGCPQHKKASQQRLLLGPLPPCCFMRCRDEVDKRGYMMQRVVDVHVGFVREAPHTALQVGTSSCWLTPGSRPRASPGLPALLPGWRCCRGMAAMLSTSILQCSRRVMLCQFS